MTQKIPILYTVFRCSHACLLVHNARRTFTFPVPTTVLGAHSQFKSSPKIFTHTYRWRQRTKHNILELDRLVSCQRTETSLIVRVVLLLPTRCPPVSRSFNTFVIYLIICIRIYHLLNNVELSILKNVNYHIFI